MEDSSRFIKMIGTVRCVSGARTQLAHSGRAEPISIVDSMFGIPGEYSFTYGEHVRPSCLKCCRADAVALTPVSTCFNSGRVY